MCAATVIAVGTVLPLASPRVAVAITLGLVVVVAVAVGVCQRKAHGPPHVPAGDRLRNRSTQARAGPVQPVALRLPLRQLPGGDVPADGYLCSRSVCLDDSAASPSSPCRRHGRRPGHVVDVRPLDRPQPDRHRYAVPHLDQQGGKPQQPSGAGRSGVGTSARPHLAWAGGTRDRHGPFRAPYADRPDPSAQRPARLAADGRLGRCDAVRRRRRAHPVADGPNRADGGKL